MDRLEKLFTTIYDEHADAIFRYCLYRVYDREKAKDVTQESYMRLWNMMTEGKNIKNHRAMLYTVARNLIIDSTRKKSSTESSLDVLLEAGWQVSDHTEGAQRKNDTLDVHRALEQLREHNHEWGECVELRYLDGLAVKDIAAVLEVSPNVISVRIYRGVRQLKKIMQYEATK